MNIFRGEVLARDFMVKPSISSAQLIDRVGVDLIRIWIFSLSIERRVDI
jgi:hypothetical protein